MEQDRQELMQMNRKGMENLHDSFNNSGVAYSDLVSRLERVINVVAPIKKVRTEKKQK